MQKTFDKKKFLSQNSIWLVLIAMVIIMGVAQPSFFTVNNLLTLLSGEAVKGILAFGVMFAISAFLLTQTRFGKNVYAIGGNDQAARVAGINVEKNLIMVYVWCSVCAAVAGILLAGRAGSADPANSGLNYELDAIAAATVGGTSHTGGICRVSGVLAGILILGVINNGLVMLKVDDNMTNIVKGLIIVGSVILDMRKNAKRA